MPNNLNEYRDPEQNFDESNYYRGPQKLDRSQKIALAILSLFAILVVLVWGLQVKNSLSPKDVNISTGGSCPGGNCAGSSSDADLRLKDTDKDGLSDYDELNIYGTSPYLEDSDSDGISDYNEIQKGSDPNCPVGQQCVVSPIDGAAAAGNPLEDFLPPSDLGPTNIEGVMESAEKVLMGEGDAASLRNMLVQSGMDPAVLEQISDEELLATYEEILAN
jgi:hypothetical protein